MCAFVADMPKLPCCSHFGLIWHPWGMVLFFREKYFVSPLLPACLAVSRSLQEVGCGRAWTAASHLQAWGEIYTNICPSAGDCLKSMKWEVHPDSRTCPACEAQQRPPSRAPCCRLCLLWAPWTTAEIMLPETSWWNTDGSQRLFPSISRPEGMTVILLFIPSEPQTEDFLHGKDGNSLSAELRRLGGSMATSCHDRAHCSAWSLQESSSPRCQELEAPTGKRSPWLSKTHDLLRHCLWCCHNVLVGCAAFPLAP